MTEKAKKANRWGFLGSVATTTIGLFYAAFWDFLNASAITDYFELSKEWNLRGGLILAAIGYIATVTSEQMRIRELEERLNDKELREKRLSYARFKLRALAMEADRIPEVQPAFLPNAIAWRKKTEVFLREAFDETYVYDFTRLDSVYGGPTLEMMRSHECDRIRQRLSNHSGYLIHLWGSFSYEDLNPAWIPPERENITLKRDNDIVAIID